MNLIPDALSVYRLDFSVVVDAGEGNDAISDPRRQDALRALGGRYSFHPEAIFSWSNVERNVTRQKILNYYPFGSSSGPPTADAWIAAAAVQLNVPLATHSAPDYVAVEGLTILTALARP